MRIRRRDFLKGSASVAAASGLPVDSISVPAEKAYPYLGRTEDYVDFRHPAGPDHYRDRIMGAGLLRLRAHHHERRTRGLGQLSTFEPDISAIVLHRQVAPHVLGSDPALIDALVDRVIDANMKFPWSYVCRALAAWTRPSGISTARSRASRFASCSAARPIPFPVYGSSMRRDITPEDEAARLARLRDEKGFKAFKVRLGTPTGHDGDAAPGPHGEDDPRRAQGGR